MNKTRTGKDCQIWSSDYPHGHDYNWVGNHNYCRNPVDKWGGRIHPVSKAAERAWCYTTDMGTKWEYCDIRDCTDCDQGEEPRGFTLILKFLKEIVKTQPLLNLIQSNSK